MFVIGIEGKSGSGKTTTCKYFNEKHGVHTINVDNLMMDNGLWGDFDKLVFSLQKGNSAHYTRKTAGKDGIRDKKLSLNLKAAIKVAILARKVNKLINQQLKECQANGEEYVIVDFAKLDAMGCWKKMDARILVESNDTRRKSGLKEREGDGFEEWMQKYDSFLEYGILQYDEKSITHRIMNNGDLADLHQQIDAVFAQLQSLKRIKEFKERIQVSFLPIDRKAGNKEIDVRDIIRDSGR